MKKVLAIFFALCLAALLAPSARAATVVASGSCGENVTWVLDDAGTLTISGTGAMVDYDSTNAVSWRNLRSSITAVVVEDGVTSIGRYAFCWCTNLKEVTIGKDVEHIGESAFSYCYSLTDITIPDSVTSVGDEAFHYCKSLISVKLPAGITRIEERMFLSCESLADITIPDSVTYVDESAFHLCSNLKNIYYGGSLQDWGGITFGDAYANPMYYAENAYLDGELLEGDVVISDDIPEIHDYAFISYGRITGLTIQNGVTDIGEHAFEYCDGLKSVAIGPDVTEIGAFAFSGCDNLTDITVLGNNVTIELGAFQLCGALTNLNLGSGVVCIRKATVSFEGALSINYYLTPSAPVAGEMKLYIWSPETYDSVLVLTADNAVAVTMENRNGTYFASVSGIAPKDLDKTYYVAAVYTDAQGNTYCTGVIAYSLSRYCMVNANGNMGDLAKNTAMYGYYADNYFE